ncbi:hypothetical protein FTUN_1797 [Frigoriglobus tundricola]|uniref:Uncharacterized protein n=1 Tax=Frigoriglobus tundricola TaxID=2774151 RepID=A0A6M5YJP4_9BACT|nr:hypothetical protein FTUN_1797 [Frigoriglobus tundricola]
MGRPREQGERSPADENKRACEGDERRSSGAVTGTSLGRAVGLVE